jgi:hypothetical protein
MINSYFKNSKVFAFFISLKMTKIKRVKRGRIVVLFQEEYNEILLFKQNKLNLNITRWFKDKRRNFKDRTSKFVL